MKRKIKIILIIVGVLVGVILLDTFQARVLKHSPIISWKEKLEDHDSWVDKGILIDTYYCTREQDIVTIHWEIKGSKFTCPIDNGSISYLRKLQEDITDILALKNYPNFSAIYVDEENQMLIIKLEDNSKTEQDWFRKNIIDSEYIKFEQGGPYTTSQFDFYISKTAIHDDIKFNDYYKNQERIIYLAGNIEEFYVVNNNKEDTLKNYIALTYQTFDDSMKSITAKLDEKEILKDGGSTLSKSKEKNLTMVICKTIAGNKNVYIGDYSMEYEQNMCS